MAFRAAFHGGSALLLGSADRIRCSVGFSIVEIRRWELHRMLFPRFHAPPLRVAWRTTLHHTLGCKSVPRIAALKFLFDAPVTVFRPSAGNVRRARRWCSGETRDPDAHGDEVAQRQQPEAGQNLVVAENLAPTVMARARRRKKLKPSSHRLSGLSPLATH